MVRPSPTRPRRWRRFPHGCGDGPSWWRMLTDGSSFSPRVWGWSAGGTLAAVGGVVFPTGVGMVRIRRRPERSRLSFPHGCGDGPGARVAHSRTCPFSPRVWGWSGSWAQGGKCGSVFPTGVGMVRTRPVSRSSFLGFPHGCGDGPACFLRAAVADAFSPRVWGWSARRFGCTAPTVVFPTGVGMVRPLARFRSRSRRFPHGCGDGPAVLAAETAAYRFSPRVWGWSVIRRESSSPEPVFPTGVGMVRRPRPGSRHCRRFPHGCGDGPPCLLMPSPYRGFSPRVWGWSEQRSRAHHGLQVFPTGVGMVAELRLHLDGPSAKLTGGCPLLRPHPLCSHLRRNTLAWSCPHPERGQPFS